MKNINTIAPHSRVWIYQSSRMLTAAEVSIIKQRSVLFIDQWTSHGNQMDACIEVLHNCFVIVFVDEQTASASGCGIDKSVHFIQNLEKELNVSLMERTNVAYRGNDNSIKLSSLKEFEQLIDTGLVSGDTIVFNNVISTKQELLTKWEVSVSSSWLSRFQKKPVK